MEFLRSFHRSHLGAGGGGRGTSGSVAKCRLFSHALIISCHSNEMKPLLPILLAAVFLGIGNCLSKIVHGNFSLQ